MNNRFVLWVLEGRPTFEQLIVEKNLKVVAYSRKERAAIKKDLERVYLLSPLSKYTLANKRALVRSGEADAGHGKGLNGQSYINAP